MAFNWPLKHSFSNTNKNNFPVVESHHSLLRLTDDVKADNLPREGRDWLAGRLGDAERLERVDGASVGEDDEVEAVARLEGRPPRDARGGDAVRSVDLALERSVQCESLAPCDEVAVHVEEEQAQARSATTVAIYATIIIVTFITL